jgi:hypothetical protein
MGRTARASTAIWSAAAGVAAGIAAATLVRPTRPPSDLADPAAASPSHSTSEPSGATDDHGRRVRTTVIPLAVYGFLAAGAVRLVAERFYGRVDVAVDELGVSTWHLFTNAAKAAAFGVFVVGLTVLPAYAAGAGTWRWLRACAAPPGRPARSIAFAATAAGVAAAVALATGFGVLTAYVHLVAPSIADELAVTGGIVGALGVAELYVRGSKLAATPALYVLLAAAVIWLGGLAGSTHAPAILHDATPRKNFGALLADIAVAPGASRVCVTEPGSTSPTLFFYLGGANGTIVLLDNRGRGVTRLPADTTTMAPPTPTGEC